LTRQSQQLAEAVQQQRLAEAAAGKGDHIMSDDTGALPLSPPASATQSDAELVAHSARLRAEAEELRATLAERMARATEVVRQSRALRAVLAAERDATPET
jgi:hypothetical protein